MALEFAAAFDGSGTTVLDLSGNGRNLDLTGSAGAQVTGGQTGNALGKTGATMPTLPSSVLAASQTDDRTIMFDAKQNVTTWWVRFNDTTFGSGMWGVLNLGSMAVQARDNTGSHNLATRPTATAPDSAGWHNYCATYVRSTGVISLYRDGTLATTTSFTAGTQLSTSATSIDLAEWSSTGAAIDNLRIYSHALTAGQVATLAGTPVTASGVTGSGAATAPTGVASGSGGVLAAGTGTATPGGASTAGAGGVLVSATGSLTPSLVVATGTGVVAVAGVGVAAVATASVAGAGAVVVTATSSASVAPASGSGAGTVTVAAVGDLHAPVASVAGTGTVADPLIFGDGALLALPAVSGGFGSVLVAGGGSTAAPPAAASGTGTVLVEVISGVGALSATQATCVGVGGVLIAGAGSAVAPHAVVSGSDAAPVMAPPERTSTVAAESRVMVVLPEPRMGGGAMSDSYIHSPNAVLPYGRDWAPWLAAGDTIATSTWTVPTGLAMGATSVDGGQTTVWLSGGTLGEDYTVVNHIVTAGGMEDDRSIHIRVRNR